jgi:hypothetical protein
MGDAKNLEQWLNLNEQLNAFDKQERKEQLISIVNHLLLHDFNKLIQVLYRVDVSEQKLKDLLQKNLQTDAAIIIADLLIERQQEKIKIKESFNTDNHIPDEEKW